MSFFGSLFGTDQQKDIDRGFRESSNLLESGRRMAEGNINTGNNQADAALSGAQGFADTAYRDGINALDTTYREGQAFLNPYLRAGEQANALYGNALGLNGLSAQQAFAQNYAASDPFRQQNALMANEALMKTLNARGLSGGGYAAEAVARQNLMRGSEDYGNYLSRLSGAQAQGQQAAGAAAGLASDFGRNRASYLGEFQNAMGNYATQRGNNATNRGNALANLNYGNAQQTAGMRTGYANATAQNRSTGINNLFGIAGLGVNALTGGLGGR